METARKDKEPRPNILIVILDAVRAANLPCYGYDRSTAPFLDQFARRSTLFENAYSPAPWTLPAHASMLTGLYPSEHKAHAKHPYLSREIPYLPEMLASIGYDTCLCAHVPFLTEQFGMTRGFSNQYQPYQVAHRLARFRDRPIGRGWGQRLLRLCDRIYRRVAAKMGDSGARPMTKAAIRWITTRPRERNWFLLINYFDAHLPYWPPARFRRAFLPPNASTAQLKRVNQNPWAYYSGRAPMSSEDFALLKCLYDAAILYLDHWVGRLITSLETSGILERTLVIITSDHGENFTEKPVFGHNLYLNEQLLRVPLIVYYPKHFPPGLRVSQRIQLLDIFYTALRAVGLPFPEGPRVRVRSLMDALSDEDFSIPIFAQYHGLRATPADQRHKQRYPEIDFEPFDRPSYAVIKGDYKLIYTPGYGGELYHLGTDPGETTDLYNDKREIAEDLAQLLHSAFDLKVEPSGTEYEIDPEVERRLADLGYI